MKNYLIFVFAVASMAKQSVCFAQKLVPNGSFEQLTSCPTDFSGLDSCVGWFSASNSPDGFATCSPYPVSVPNNFAGSQLPFDGFNYAGFYTYASSSGDYREVFGMKIADSLNIGNIYHFSMRICRAFNSTYGIVIGTNHLGAKLSKYKVYGVPFSFDNFQQLDEDSVVTDSINWTLLQWNFVADSSYKYIYIGNFHDDSQTEIVNSTADNQYAYYYSDSINLFCLTCPTSVNNTIFKEPSYAFNGRSKEIRFQNLGQTGGYFTLVNILGQEVLKERINNTSIISLRQLEQGIYIIFIQTPRGTITNKIYIDF